MKLLSVPEAAELLSVSQKKIWNLIYGREIDTVRIGRCVRIPEETVAGLIERSRTPARVA
jgi:excisionase family DNA binding protein